MSPEKVDEILGKIDAAVGPPDSETPEEREQRRQMIERRARRKELGVA